MSTTRGLRATAIAAIAAGALFLTACGAGGQSTEEACKIIQSSVEKSTAALQESLTQMATDQDKAVSSLDKLNAEFSSASEKVTNEDVKAKAEAAANAVESVVAEVKSIVADPENADQAKLMESATNMQTSFADVMTTCK